MKIIKPIKTMLVLIIMGVIILIGLLIIYLTRDDWDLDGLRILSIVGTILASVIFIGMCIAIPVRRYEVRSDIAKMSAFRETIKNSRLQDLSDYERFTILRDIAEWNEKLAVCKFDNQNGWDLWIPDEIETIEPIK